MPERRTTRPVWVFPLCSSPHSHPHRKRRGLPRPGEQGTRQKIGQPVQGCSDCEGNGPLRKPPARQVSVHRGQKGDPAVAGWLLMDRPRLWSFVIRPGHAAVCLEPLSTLHACIRRSKKKRQPSALPLFSLFKLYNIIQLLSILQKISNVFKIITA